MKKINISIISLFLLVLVGCEVIDGTNYQIDYEPPIGQDGETTRNILLEDYTGIRCTNCPEAAAKIENLKSALGERLIAVSIHAGHFARPIGIYDLRCEAGTEYYTSFGVKSNPSGIINRSLFDKQMVLSLAKWDASIIQVPTDAMVVMKKPSIVYNSENRTFSVSLEIKNLSGASTTYSLLLWLIEDYIITPQDTKDGVVDNYVQRHVLRGALNGIWGEDVVLDPSKGYISLERVEYTLKEGYKAEDCSILALVCDKQTKEVLQVVEGSFSVLH